MSESPMPAIRGFAPKGGPERYHPEGSKVWVARRIWGKALADQRGLVLGKALRNRESRGRDEDKSRKALRTRFRTREGKSPRGGA